MDETFVVIDTETTQNKITKKEEMVEFSGIEINSRLEKINEIHFLINPTIPLSFITKRITGLKDEDLKYKDPIQRVLPSILLFISQKKIIAYNSNFDYTVLNNACKKCNFSNLENTFIDALKIARNLFPNERNNLSCLKERFGILTKSHRAKEDVDSTIMVLIRMAEIYKQKMGKELVDDFHLFRNEK